MDIYLVPGLFLIDLWHAFAGSQPDLYRDRSIAVIISLFAWIWGLSLFMSLLSKVFSNWSSGGGSEFSMEKSLSWLCLMLGIVAGILATPFLIRVGLTAVKSLFLEQGVSMAVSTALGWVVIFALAIAIVFFVHTTLNVFLLKRTIRRFSS